MKEYVLQSYNFHDIYKSYPVGVAEVEIPVGSILIDSQAWQDSDPYFLYLAVRGECRMEKRRLIFMVHGHTIVLEDHETVRHICTRRVGNADFVRMFEVIPNVINA